MCLSVDMSRVPAAQVHRAHGTLTSRLSVPPSQGQTLGPPPPLHCGVLSGSHGWQSSPRWGTSCSATLTVKAEGCTPQSPRLTDPRTSREDTWGPCGGCSALHQAAPRTPCSSPMPLAGLGEVSSSPGQPVRDESPQGGWRHSSLLLWDTEERWPTGRRVSDCRLQKSRHGHLGDSQARCCPKHPLRRGPHRGGETHPPAGDRTGVVRSSSGWGQDRVFGQFQSPSRGEWAPGLLLGPTPAAGLLGRVGVRTAVEDASAAGLGSSPGAVTTAEPLARTLGMGPTERKTRSHPPSRAQAQR